MTGGAKVQLLARRWRTFRERPEIKLVLLVTAAVLVVPSAVSWGLLAAGLVAQAWQSIVLACVASLVICQLGGMLWERHRGSADVLFSDLLLWGWLRRRAMERRLANAAALFASTEGRAERYGAGGRENPQTLLRRLAADLEESDPYTHGHSRRVARYASLIAQRMGLTPAQVRQIRLAATLHDVGKLYIPRQILNKPGRLTDAEYEAVKRHPGDGARMIASLIDDPELVSIVRHHHERLDGTGYPAQLAGEEIPVGARIIAVADTFDAITSRRSYRESSPHKAALDIMRAEAGSQLDPDAVRAFRSAYFGRRWLWLPAAALSSSEQLLQAAVTRLADAAAIVASTTALGAGAIPLFSAYRSGSGSVRTSQLASTGDLHAGRSARTGIVRVQPVSGGARTLSGGASPGHTRTKGASASRQRRSSLNSSPGRAQKNAGRSNSATAGSATTTAGGSGTVAVVAGPSPAVTTVSASAGTAGISAAVTGPGGSSATATGSSGSSGVAAKAGSSTLGATVSAGASQPPTVTITAAAPALGSASLVNPGWTLQRAARAR
jgi:putative nucleotidyltransferase with HDIG domain